MSKWESEMSLSLNMRKNGHAIFSQKTAELVLSEFVIYKCNLRLIWKFGNSDKVVLHGPLIKSLSTVQHLKNYKALT